MLAGRQARGRLGSSARRAIPLADAAAAPARCATAYSGSMDERNVDSTRSNVDRAHRDFHKCRERGIAHGIVLIRGRPSCVWRLRFLANHPGYGSAVPPCIYSSDHRSQYTGQYRGAFCAHRHTVTPARKSWLTQSPTRPASTIEPKTKLASHQVPPNMGTARAK